MISAWELFVTRQSSSSSSFDTSSSSSSLLSLTSSRKYFSNSSTAYYTSISCITWFSSMLTQFVTMDEKSCTDSFLPCSSAMEYTRLGGCTFPLSAIAQLIFASIPSIEHSLIKYLSEIVFSFFGREAEPTSLLIVAFSDAERIPAFF